MDTVTIGRYESNLRTIGAYGISALAIITSLFHLYTGAFGVFGALVQRPVHVYLLAALTFAIVPFMGEEKIRYRIVDLVLVACSLGAMGYVLVEYPRLLNATPYVGAPETMDWVVGVLSVILVIEATRRIVGRLLAAVAILILVATFYADVLPAPLTAPRLPASNWIDGLFVTTQGLWSVPVRVSASFIFLFVVLAAFLEATGAGRFLLDLANALVGHLVGGAAKVSVVASSIFGSLSGSAAANVYGTGIFTIPTMKKFGFSSRMAGATEVSASNGGQLMPPIMGAGAFIMAQFLGTEYIVIALAAIIPAALYYLSVYFSIHAQAIKLDIDPVPKEEQKNALNVLKEKPGQASTLALTVGVLFFMLMQGYTIYRSIFFSIAVMMIVSSLQPDSRLGVKELVVAFDKGARNATQIAMACAAAAIVLGALNISGLGVVFGQIVVALSQGIIPLLLILVAAFSIILGFGMPTTAAYILAASLLAPGLAEVGLAGLPGHFFIFTFAVYSTLTPPVALAAFAAGQIADADPIRIALIAMKIVLPTFIIPARYVLYPAILLEMAWAYVLLDVFILSVAVIAIQAGIWGWPVKNKMARGFATFGALVLIVPPPLLPIGVIELAALGLVLVAFAGVLHVTAERRAQQPTA